MLRQFGYWDGQPLGERIAPALIGAARAEADDDVREMLVLALGSTDDRAWVPALSVFADDRHAAIRRAVASSLPIMFAGDPMDDPAVSTLIGLTHDDDPEMRDWATMALGTQSDLDTAAIRDALAARLDGAGGDTALEAVIGLDRRGDVRARESLISRLGAPDQPVNSMDLEAAAALADPVLMPLLRRLAQEWCEEQDDHTRALDHAIARCAPEAVALAAEREAQLVAAIELGLAGTGWKVALPGSYPRTAMTFLRPDGTPDPPPSCWLVWDDDTDPQRFDPQIQAEQWVWEIEARRQTGAEAEQEPPGG